jgi:stearoyl-CoA desaturase (delta-9 desaturase)
LLPILAFFISHWVISVFFQTFFLHRYGAHKQFTMSPGWERCFYFMTFLSQGSSFLVPRAYAYLHREHHAFSDTRRDPHSPLFHKNVFAMMWQTKVRYEGFAKRRIEPEPRFRGDTPEWAGLDAVADRWTVRVGFGALYTLFYVVFAPSWVFFLLLPAHFLMGPIHGAIVNWGGHKYGYRNFDTADRSRNTLPFDFLTLGELFQNNHHKYGMSPDFGVRWFEIDPTYPVLRLFAALGIIQIPARPRGAEVVDLVGPGEAGPRGAHESGRA